MRLASVALIGLWVCLAGEALADEETIERGRYLFQAALCGACHTAEDGKPLAGGRAIRSPFGTFYSTNITPDPIHGIGHWSEADFVRALRRGVSPKGSHYYPAFPYNAYTRLTRPDMLAIKAYLDTVEPVARPNRPHELVWYARWRGMVGIWKWLFFEPGEYESDAAQSAEWNRGAYLADGATHCPECHTPRNAFGALRERLRYAGQRDDPEGESTPNITPHASGIGKWNRRALSFYLEIGMTPGGDFAGGLMATVIDQGTSRLNARDRDAIATYVLSLPPIDTSSE
jgi:mono/diheme cytochrome c family protein